MIKIVFCGLFLDCVRSCVNVLGVRGVHFYGVGNYRTGPGLRPLNTNGPGLPRSHCEEFRYQIVYGLAPILHLSRGLLAGQ